MPGQTHQAQGTRGGEAGEIERAAPFGPFAEASRGDAVNVDTSPKLATGKFLFQMVISPSAGHHRHRMAALGQPQGQVRQVLRGRDDVRVEGLVEQQESH